MLLFSILSLLFSNAVTTRRDLSILFNRNAMIALTYCILHHIMSLAIISKGVVGLHGGLLQITNITQIFQIFLFFISIFILLLTSFHSGKVLVYEYPSLENGIFNTFYSTKLINKMGEHLKIIEYPVKGSRKLFRSKKLPLTSYNLIMNKRLFSTNVVEIQKGNTDFSPSGGNNHPEGDFSKYSLNPWFVTGFTDGDGSFTLYVSKATTGKLLCKVQPAFTIGLDYKDLILLQEIKKFFGEVGKIHTRKDGSGVQYVISSAKDLTNYVIPHFDTYPLCSQKKADYELFKEIVILIRNKVSGVLRLKRTSFEHLTDQGLLKLMALKASLNLGLKGW